MTVVYAWKQHHSIISDALITSWKDAEDGTDFPYAIQSSERLVNRGFHGLFRSMISKIHVLDKNVVIGFSGQLIAASYVIKELSKFPNFQSSNDVVEKLYFIFKKESSFEHFLDLSIVGIFCACDNSVDTFAFDFTDGKSKIGKNYAIGSGAEYLREVLSVPSIALSHAGDHVRATLGKIGHLLLNHAISDRQFEHAIGGTYVGGVFIDGHFTWVPDFSVLTFMAQVDINGRIVKQAPFYFVNQKMVGDEILIRRQSMEPSAGEYKGLPNSKIDYGNLVSPILNSKRNLFDLEKAAFSSFDEDFFITNAVIVNPIRAFSTSMLFSKGSGEFPFRVEGSMKGDHIIHIDKDLENLLIGYSFLDGIPVVDP